MMRKKTRTFLSIQDISTAKIVELLTILCNKARCEHSTETTFRMLKELSIRLSRDEYSELFISISHIEGEGPEEFDDVIQKLIKKYERS